MNGIEKITARLEADARAEIDAMNAETAAQCEEIKKQYEKAAQDEYWKRIQAGTKACEDRVQRLGSAADMEAKKFILSFKQEMVGKAFDHAAETIRSMPRSEYVAFLANQAAKASVYGTEELIFNASDRDKVGADVAKAANAILSGAGKSGKLTVSGETREMSGGLVVRQGDIEVNCAIDTLVQISRSELASQVAEILFA
jgi:V/A-type H+-transporting ATPase subunit E